MLSFLSTAWFLEIPGKKTFTFKVKCLNFTYIIAIIWLSLCYLCLGCLHTCTQQPFRQDIKVDQIVLDIQVKILTYLIFFIWLAIALLVMNGISSYLSTTTLRTLSLRRSISIWLWLINDLDFEGQIIVMAHFISIYSHNF
jgi:hypothetical protein